MPSTLYFAKILPLISHSRTLNMANAFTRWLKKSGTHYTSCHRSDAQYGQAVIDSLNPFDVILESERYPMTKIYRSDFCDGFMDTYDIFMGRHYFTSEGRKGLLDILLFPLVARHLAEWLSSYSPKSLTADVLSLIPTIVVICTTVILEAARFLLGIALTIAVSPFIALVHFFLYPKKKSLQTKINHLKIATPNTKTTFREHYRQEGARGFTNMIEHYQNNKVKVYKWHNPDTNKFGLGVTAGWYASERFEIACNKENEPGIRALFAMNTFNILKSLGGESVENILKNPNKLAREAFVDGLAKSKRNQSTLTTLVNSNIFEPKLLNIIFSDAGIDEPKRCLI